MYNVDTETCVGDRIPPKPSVTSEPKLGSLDYTSGIAPPTQCPNIKINANFASYQAGTITGTDRFKIKWRSSSGYIFYRSYIINIK